MLDLTEMKYQYEIKMANTKASNVKTATKAYASNAVNTQGKTAETESFKICFNNAANTAQKTSKSDYSKAEWEAQRVKNTAIGKLQQLDGDIAAMERVAPNASKEVQSAWIDAARETGYNGLGYVNGNSGAGATRLYAEMNTSAKMTDNSISGVQDILGGTVDSAIDAISSAKYDRNNIETTEGNRENAAKENAFYDSFLEKLNGIKDGNYTPSSLSAFDRMNKNNLEMFPEKEMAAKQIEEIPENYYGSAFFNETTTTAADGKLYELKAKYPGDYDPTNPAVEVYVTGNGEESLFRVNVKDVNPLTASQTELYGLFAYADDDRNVPRNIDPDSSDIYYSSLDSKYARIREESSYNNDTTELVNTFKSMDNLSYWDKKELFANTNS